MTCGAGGGPVPPSPQAVGAEAEEVPAPFQPVRVQSPSEGEGPLEIGVWGRVYRFERGPLPAGLASQDIDLWLRAPRFEADASGEPSEFVWDRPRVVSASPAQVVLECAGRAGPVSASARTQVEFDGMLRVDLRLTAEQEVQLHRFSYELAFPRSVAQYVTHHLQYDYENLRADKSQLVASAGRAPSQATSLPFVPTVSIGNRQVGIEWWTETNVGWKSPPGRDPIELVPDDAGLALRVTPIRGDVSLAPGADWSHTFALFPLPVREAPSRWRSFVFGPPDQAKRFGKDSGDHFVFIAFPGHFEALWHGLPASKDDDAQRRLRARLSADGVTYIPYGKLSAVPSLHPRAMANADQWAATHRLFTSPPASERRFLLSQGWKPGTPYSYAACVEAPGYLDWILEENLATLRREHLGGLYFDLAGILEPCQRPPYVSDPDREQRWSYFALRDFYKRLYIAVKKQSPETLITIHAQGEPRALAEFVDYMFVGEALNVLFRDGHSWRDLEKHPELYDPDYFALPTGFLEALLLPRVGGVTSLLPQVRRGKYPVDPRRVARRTRELLAITLVNDMHVFVSNSDAETRVPVYRALDRFGSLDEARLDPWWEPTPAIRHDPGLRVTAYRKPDRVLLIVANWGDRPIESAIVLDPAALGLPGASSFRDLEHPRAKARALREGSFEAKVPARDFRLYQVE